MSHANSLVKQAYVTMLDDENLFQEKNLNYKKNNDTMN
jgi:hypothetical protein